MTKSLGILVALGLWAQPALAQDTATQITAAASQVTTHNSEHKIILLLRPRSGRSDRARALEFDQGLQKAVNDMHFDLKSEADLAAATPGDIVARCPARISSSCLSQAAKKTGSAYVMTGQIESHGAVLNAQIKILSATQNKIMLIRDINFAPSRHDPLDLQLAGRCLGQALLKELDHDAPPGSSEICSGRLFVTTAADREFYRQQSQVPPAQQWVTILPAIDTRQVYEKHNNVLAGSFASAGALAVVGLTTSIFLLAQSRLTHGEIVDFANSNPTSFKVQDKQIWLIDSSTEAAARYRSLQSRERMESLTSMSAGLAAFVAGIVAVALYDQAEIPGRYEAYTSAPAEVFARVKKSPAKQLTD